MTHLTYSGLCCFCFFTERIDERNSKASIATSKCRPTTCVGVFWEIMPPCRPPTGSKFRNVQVLLTFLMCVNLQHFVTERDIQWNPSIAATVGEWHFGCYTEVAVVEG